MTQYDNRGRVSLWKSESDSPKAPAYRGTVVAHRDIREGEELEIALWPNISENPRAPKVWGKVSDKYQGGVQQSGASKSSEPAQKVNTPDQVGGGEFDDMPFAQHERGAFA